jgi:hypothetical protein
MNATFVKAAIAFVPASLLLAHSVAVFLRGRTIPSVLQLVGAACLMSVILTHVAEALHLLQWMRWGDPNSAGHYLDLISAVLGIGLLALAVVLRVSRVPSSSR